MWWLSVKTAGAGEPWSADALQRGRRGMKGGEEETNKAAALATKMVSPPNHVLPSRDRLSVTAGWLVNHISTPFSTGKAHIDGVQMQKKDRDR